MTRKAFIPSLAYPGTTRKNTKERNKGRRKEKKNRSLDVFKALRWGEGGKKGTPVCLAAFVTPGAQQGTR